MKALQDDLLHALEISRDESALFGHVAAFARSLGFDHCAYGARLPLPIAQPKTMMLNDYPEAWRTRYSERRYLLVDPVVKHGGRSLLPIVWSDTLFAAARPLWEDARMFGLRFGWSQSSRSAQGVMGMLSVSRAEEPITRSERIATEARLVWLAQIAHIGISRILIEREIPEATAALTLREIEVLQWSADGKTSGEIAAILHVSERTVNFHLGNAASKLQAPNRTAAVVRAATLGQLFGSSLATADKNRR